MWKRGLKPLTSCGTFQICKAKSLPPSSLRTSAEVAERFFLGNVWRHAVVITDWVCKILQPSGLGKTSKALHATEIGGWRSLILPSILPSGAGWVKLLSLRSKRINSTLDRWGNHGMDSTCF